MGSIDPGLIKLIGCNSPSWMITLILVFVSLRDNSSSLATDAERLLCHHGYKNLQSKVINVCLSYHQEKCFHLKIANFRRTDFPFLCKQFQFLNPSERFFFKSSYSWISYLDNFILLSSFGFMEMFSHSSCQLKPTSSFNEDMRKKD